MFSQIAAGINRNLAQSISPPSPAPPPPSPPFALVALPSLDGGQIILYGIIITGIIVLALCLTARALYLRSLVTPNGQNLVWNPNNLSGQNINPGLDPAIVSNFPVLKYGDMKRIDPEMDSSCVVCLEDYKELDELRRLPDCGHSFHTSCIDSWLQQHTTCPTCRASLMPKPEMPFSSEAPDSGSEHTAESGGDSDGHQHQLLHHVSIAVPESHTHEAHQV